MPELHLDCPKLSTHTHTKSKTMVFPPSKEAYEALINEVKVLKEENKRLRYIGSPAEVELKDRKPREHKARRDSWVDIYNETTALHKSKRLLGHSVEIDDGLEWRVKWGQRGMGVCGLLALIFWVVIHTFFYKKNVSIAPGFTVFAALGLLFAGMLYYKNFSFAIAKRLLRETKVVIILVFGLIIWSIDIARPSTSRSPINGFLYMLSVFGFVFGDAIKVKSRLFAMVLGTLFLVGTIINIYNLIFRDWDQGIVLFKYAIQENDYTFMKRSAKRSIFIQIMLFSMNGLYTLFKDRKQELMVFATGHIYRETGTASREVKDKQYSIKLKSEKKSPSKKIELESVV